MNNEQIFQERSNALVGCVMDAIWWASPTIMIMSRVCFPYFQNIFLCLFNYFGCLSIFALSISIKLSYGMLFSFSFFWNCMMFADTKPLRQTLTQEKTKLWKKKALPNCGCYYNHYHLHHYHFHHCHYYHHHHHLHQLSVCGIGSLTGRECDGGGVREGV